MIAWQTAAEAMSVAGRPDSPTPKRPPTMRMQFSLCFPGTYFFTRSGGALLLWLLFAHNALTISKMCDSIPNVFQCLAIFHTLLSVISGVQL